ncbi:class I SAM-dependent methyltransferase [Mycolicibacterium sp. 3033]|nr:class I SAM-dependent methyltransferase [Mycolicibacterium aurantiacum]
MDQTPSLARFDDTYKNQTPPWVIGEPQPAIVAFERDGHIRGRVLDIGCGTGEHTILLTRLGYDVVGVDGAPTAVEQARRNAGAHGVDARFAVRDALDLGTSPTFDTVVDSALFHVFDAGDRVRYVRSLRNVTLPGALVAVLALSDAGRGFGPQVSEADVRGAFAEGWSIEELSATTYRGVVTDMQADALGLEVGTRVDEPALLVRARRA